jgi:hypothetical protein
MAEMEFQPEDSTSCLQDVRYWTDKLPVQWKLAVRGARKAD